MLTTFSLKNEYETRQWDDFVISHPDGSPYHLSNWIRVIQETYSFRPLLYVYKNQSGDLCGIFPCFYIRSLITGSRIISLPFSDYCGPLFKDKDNEKKILSKIVKKNRHKINCIEIRNQIEDNSDFICHNHYIHHVLNLDPDIFKLQKIMNKRTIQYSIRKAKKRGIEIIEENSLNGIDEFYKLNKLTRKKHGVPFQPEMFFKKIYEYMISKGHGFILLALYDSKVVAAILFLKFKNGIYYKYNVSDPKLLSKLTPNHLLTWSAIKNACQAGYQFIDFGRTSITNKGLMRYKEMWGAIGINLPYYYYPKIRGFNAKEESSLFYRTITNIWGSLPDNILTKLGPLLYKYTA